MKQLGVAQVLVNIKLNQINIFIIPKETINQT